MVFIIMSFLKKTIFIVYVFCIGNASFSWAQDKERFDKKFSEKYAFVKDLNDLSELPFIETSEDEAQRVLTTSSHFFAPFGTKLSEYQNRFFYQLFGVNCPAILYPYAITLSRKAGTAVLLRACTVPLTLNEINQNFLKGAPNAKFKRFRTEPYMWWLGFRRHDLRWPHVF